MKIAISGAHCTGKTSIFDALGSLLNDYNRIEEPYFLLEEEGYVFNELPSVEDFITQLDYSIELVSSYGNNTLFERCPLDFAAYINSLNNNSTILTDDYREKLIDSMEQIDIVILVPVENPDRIRCPESENPELRKEVDSELQNLIYEFEDSCEYDIIEVRGNNQKRLELVQSVLNASSRGRS